MKSKTYKSTNGWKSPQALSGFGIEVANKKEVKYLGLEEFNFIKLLEEHKLAYIPSFSTKRRDGVFDKIELYYHNGDGTTIKYATLINVCQITDKAAINKIRYEILYNMPEYVQNCVPFQEKYKLLFQAAFKKWKECYESNNIIAQGTFPRFVVNIRYEDVILHEPPIITNWVNLKRARSLYN